MLGGVAGGEAAPKGVTKFYLAIHRFNSRGTEEIFGPEEKSGFYRFELTSSVPEDFWWMAVLAQILLGPLLVSSDN